MKRLFTFLFSTMILFSCVITAMCAEININMTEQIIRPWSIYTLGDIAAARLSTYGFLDEANLTPHESTQEPITRIEAADLLYKVFASEDYAAPPCQSPDVPDEFANQIMWATQTGFTSGCDAAFFSDVDTKQSEFAAMLLCLLGYGNDFDWQDAVSFAKEIGLSPIGLSSSFTLGDAALYIQAALDLPLKDTGEPLRNLAQIESSYNEMFFPSRIEINPTSIDDAQILLKEAFRYLPERIIISVNDSFGEKDLFHLYKKKPDDKPVQ